MADVFSLCHDIERFLQQKDQNSIDQFLRWLKDRLNISKPPSCSLLDPTTKSMINTSQIFMCQCGHRYSFRFAIDDLITADDSQENEQQCQFLCTHCHSHLNNRDTFLKHHAMHKQGYTFCKRCSQFYNHRIKAHECAEQKIDELQSLEQLIPPDTTEQQQQPNSSLINNVDDHEKRLTRFGLPKLTDSLVEVIHADGKRQFRCPLCFNSYVNRSGLNRHYITHSSQDLWKVECQFCGKRYSRKDSLKHHMKTQHAHVARADWTWPHSNKSMYHRSNEKIFQSYKNLSSISDDVELTSSSSNEKEQIESDDIVLIT